MIALLLMSFVAMADGTAKVEINQPVSFEGSFQQAARKAAAKQGWPGYPDSYQDAFVAGAVWAKGKKALMCQ